MEERTEAAESATRRAAQEPEQKVHEAARSELTLRRAESARARTPHESLLLFDSIPCAIAEYHSNLEITDYSTVQVIVIDDMKRHMM